MPQNALPIQLLQGEKADSDTNYVAALPVNMSGIVRPVLNSQGFMLQQPGLTGYGSLSGPVSRGAVWNERQNNLYRVSGGKFVSVDADGISTTLGTLPGNRQASLPYSFNTQAIVVDGNYYLYDPINGFRQVNDPDLGNPIDAVWVDGYYFFTDGEYLFHTDLTNESAIDPLKFATAEFSPDPTLGVGLTPDDKVIAFGRYTTEYFINQAFDQFAFQRLPSRTVTAGIVGTHAKVRVDADNQYGNGSYFCLGGGKDSDVTVYALGVGSTVGIASREVNRIIAQYNQAQLSNVVLECRTVDEYPYLIVHLPNEVLLFNFKVAAFAGVEQAWTILVSGTQNQPYRAINGVFDPRRAQWVYGDKYDNNIAYLDSTVATHYEEIVEWSLYTPFTYLETMSIDQLSIDTVPGFTVADDATVFISLTYNGVNWTMESPLQYGQPSAYNKRFIANRLGFIRNFFAFRFRGASRSRMCFALCKILYS